MKLLFVMFLAMVTCSCSRKSESTLYQEGKTFEEDKDFPHAAERYEEVVDRFPRVAYAESSLMRLSTIYNNEMRDVRKALSTYQRFYTGFPTSKEAPSMLFLSGFLYNNELHLIDSARIAYESFLKQYPSHELAPSAKFELANLGKDPNQALETNFGSDSDSTSLQQ